MLKKSRKLISLFFLFLLLAWGAKFLWITPYDLATTTRVMKKKERLAASSETLKTSTHQIRKNVQKDIWFSQEEGGRLHYKIQSDTSLLTLEPKGRNKVEIIENLEKLKCWMQDKVYYSAEGAPLQQLRFFEADQGTYRYSSNAFDAKTVALSLFRMGGHEVPEKISSPSFIQGIAKDVRFSVSGKTPKFQAKQFEAKLKGGEL